MKIIILHGICEHGLRYAELADLLHERGSSCAYTYHPGHGQALITAKNLAEPVEQYGSSIAKSQLIKDLDGVKMNLFKKIK